MVRREAVASATRALRYRPSMKPFPTPDPPTYLEPPGGRDETTYLPYLPTYPRARGQSPREDNFTARGRWRPAREPPRNVKDAHERLMITHPIMRHSCSISRDTAGVNFEEQRICRKTHDSRASKRRRDGFSDEK
eukprot:3996290-Prymnesium_polylepis.1